MVWKQRTITSISMPLEGYVNTKEDVALECPLGQGSIYSLCFRLDSSLMLE